MQKEYIEKKIAELGAVQPWNHNFHLPHGIETHPGVQVSHGKNHVKWERIKPLLDVIGVRGKRVLDIGCNEGFFTFQLTDMGGEVLGIDVDVHRIEKANFIRSVIGRAQARFGVVDIYSSEFEEMPAFDLCLCMGFLHRVPDPFSAMARLAQKTDLILFEWKALKFGPHDDAFAYFSPKDVDEEDYYGTEYWLLSYAAVERIMRRLGFQYFHRIDDPRQKRAILVAGRNHHPLFEKPDDFIHRGRMRSLLSHSKRFANTVVGIIKGRINA